jgi:hypothetical protein
MVSPMFSIFLPRRDMDTSSSARLRDPRRVATFSVIAEKPPAVLAEIG